MGIAPSMKPYTRRQSRPRANSTVFSERNKTTRSLSGTIFHKKTLKLCTNSDDLQFDFNIEQGVQEDIKTLQQNVNNIGDLCKQLSESADQSFIQNIQTEVEVLNDKWSQVVSLAQEQNERLKKAAQSSQDVYDKIAETTEWLDPIKIDLSNKDYSIDDPEDLLSKTKKFQVSSSCGCLVLDLSSFFC